MDNLPIDAVTPEDAASGEKLQRTHGRAMAAMSFGLQWQSAEARHTDTLVARKLNLWRDILPFAMESDLMDKPVGHLATHRFAAGDLLADYDKGLCFDAPDKAFNRHYRKCYIEPRAGRFYPRGFIAGTRNIYPDDLKPFRIADRAADKLTLELNHPLADRELEFQARILDIWQAPEEHGGACNDVGEMVCNNGPGMQARRQGRETDFLADIPFMRADPSPDADFYAKPRRVQHLDAAALGQIENLYQRLLPQGGAVLDLMASWDSHLPAELNPASVVGLGMNGEELETNPVLNERRVQDLNLQPVLPFDDDCFNAVVCTASVEYLTRPLEVFAEVRRVLRPGGRFVLTFSNRWFAPKVINIWQDCHEFERMGLVLDYFLRSGGFDDLETCSLRGLARPADDKYFAQTADADPVYAVWGSRAD